MRFIVPQFIDIQDTIIGSLTLKQFFLLIGGGLILVFLWWLFELWFAILVGGPIALIFLASVFIKVGGRSLPQVFLSWFGYWTKPKFYIWKKEK